MVNCKLCGQECKSTRSLSKHIRDKHSEYDSQKYYNEFLKRPNEGICIICGNSTRFDNLSKGYKETCCHKCGGLLTRHRLKLDKEKHDVFVKKVAANQERIWQQRKGSGEDKKIGAKTRNTIKKFNKGLTKEQLKERYGWQNKLTIEEKAHWVNTVMKKTGAHNWWKTASADKKQHVVDCRNASKLGITLTEYQARFNNLADFEKYRWHVWLLTERTYKEYKQIIDPQNLRSPEYHLDHKFSIVRGFHLQIAPEIISSVHNLEILPASANTSKGGKCSLNIETLKEMYYG